MHVPNPSGDVEKTNGIRVVHLRGNPYEMGLQQGFLFREELHELIHNYLYQYLILEHGVAHAWLLSYARVFAPGVPYYLREEMQGIADGAGLSYQDVLLFNTIPDLLSLSPRLPTWESFPVLFSTTQRNNNPEHFASGMAFGAWGRAMVDNELVLGHNLDYLGKDVLAPYLLVMVRQPTMGNAFVSVGLPGMVGVWTGINEEKIAVALSCSPSLDIRTSGRPLPFLLRDVLQSAGDLDEALNVILATPRLTSGNVLLGDGKGPATIALELSAHRHAIFEVGAQRGLLARTNHFIHPELALLQQGVLSEQERETSKARLSRIQSQLEFNQSWMSVEKAIAFLIEDSNVTSSTLLDAKAASNWASPLQSVLLCPGKFTIWVASNGRMEGAISYIKLNLSQALLGRSQASY